MKGFRAAAALAAAFVMLFSSSTYAFGGEQQKIKSFNAMPASAAETAAAEAPEMSVCAVPSNSGNINETSTYAGVRQCAGDSVLRQGFVYSPLLGGKRNGSVLSKVVRDPIISVSDEEDIVSSESSKNSELEEMRSYALETQDAQCLKYIHELEEEGGKDNSVHKNSSRLSAFYGSEDLVHNPRFNGVYKDYGIDVSYFQNDIDWNKVKNDGVTFAIVRLGYRSYVKKGTLNVDRDFYKNYWGAKNAGLQVGVYFYTQATTPEEAREEADFVVSTLGGAGLDLPVFYDIETADFAPEPGRLDSAGLSVKEKTQLCRSFCDRIIEKGYWSSIYANNYWLTNMIDGYGLSNDYPIWVATYGKSTAFTGQYNMWQYSSKGKIDGISGNVDLNVRYHVDYAPTDIPVVKFSNGKISWDAINGADGYEVYAIDSSTIISFLADVSSTSYDVSDPKFSAYFVKPFNLYGGRRYTGKASEQVDAVGKVGKISCERIGIDKVRFTWDAVEGASGYEVYTDIGGSYALLCDTGKNTADLSGKDLQKYHVKIRAYNSARVYGKYSEEQHIKGNMPDGDVELRYDGGVLLWNAVDEAVGYTVYVKSNTEGEIEYDTKDLFFFADTSFDANYQVKAYCMAGGTRFYSGCKNEVEVNASKGAPKGRVELKITGGNNSTLYWNRLDGADGYTVFKADNSGNEFEIGKTDSTEYHLSDTGEGKYYVKPYCVSGEEILYGEASNTLGFFDASVIDVVEVIDDEDHCVVRWSCSQGCDEYEIYADDVLFSSVRGDMSVIDKGEIENVNTCIVRPVRFDNNTPMYGTPAQIPH